MAGTSGDQDEFNQVCLANQQWASDLRSNDPDLLAALAVGQKPKFLWLGCSDSRVPESTLLRQPPGSIFTHRNIANILRADDQSVQSVLEYALVHLRVQHVILCGHLRCGGVAASLGDPIPGAEFLNDWLAPLRALGERNAQALSALKSDPERQDYLVEQSVREGIKWLSGHRRVVEAVKDRGLQLHGAVYDVGRGDLKILKI
ncbi:MAG: hypothetical protein M1817_005868 [Caeruleum heppii]|nr:MAG: hypothetical protein M1817_005868 [Caeruleum heppii]